MDGINRCSNVFYTVNSLNMRHSRMFGIPTGLCFASSRLVNDSLLRLNTGSCVAAIYDA